MLCVVAPAALFAGVDIRLMEGTYEVDMVLFDQTEKQENQPIHDALTIRSLTLTSDRFDKLGFQSAMCNVDQDNSMRFNCEQRHFTHGRVHWDGRIDADFIQGSVVWFQGDSTVRYAFQGKRLRT